MKNLKMSATWLLVWGAFFMMLWIILTELLHGKI